MKCCLFVFVLVLSAFCQGQTVDTTKLQNDSLAQVTVTARKPLIEKRADRTVVHVDKMISAAGADAYRMLENIPGVTIDDAGNIMLNGKSGVLVLINDRQTYLTGNALINYLRSLPASMLDQVELMPNPPARYDAAGAGGVINLRVKKNTLQGLNGNINLSATQGILFSSASGASINYRRKNLSLFASGGFNTSNRFADLDILRNYYNQTGGFSSLFSQNSWIRVKDRSPNFRVGADYQLNSTTVAGITLNAMWRPSSQRTVNRSLMSGADHIVDSTTDALNQEHEKWKNHSVNLYINKKLKSSQTLDVQVDYIKYQSGNDQQFNNITANENQTYAEELKGSLPGTIDIIAGKLDYVYPLSSWRLEAGAKSSYTNTENIYRYTIVENNAERPDYDKSNHFVYNENIHAGYFSLEADRKRFNFKAGLRSEWTISRGHQLGNAIKPDSNFRRQYVNLFPTVYFTYRPDTLGKHQLTFSYGKRIERPFYQDLNPYISPLDKFTLYVGNPFLLPTIANDFSLAYTYKKRYTATLTYNKVRDAAMEAIIVDGYHYLSRPDNLGTNEIINLSLNLNLQPAKWWSSTIYTEGGDRGYRGKLFNSYMDTSALYFLVNITNQFKLGKGWAAEAGGVYRTGILVGQVSLKELWQMNVAFQKKLIRDKATIRLAVRDVFYSGVRNGEIHFLPMAKATFRNRGDLRTVSLSFAMQLGSSGQRQNRSGSADEERNRVRV